MTPSSRKWPSLPARLTVVWGGIVAAIIGVYFFAVRDGQVRHLFVATVRLGPVGFGLGFLMMALFSILPVPSEVVSILLMHQYGVWTGALISWLGGIGGAVGGLWLARTVARPMARRIGARYLKLVEPWLKTRGNLGLLVIRFVPLVPYHFVNYLAGVVDVPLLPFIWTTAAGTLPFQLGLAGVYSGFAYGSPLALILGGSFLVSLVIGGGVVRRRLMANGTLPGRLPPGKPEDDPPANPT